MLEQLTGDGGQPVLQQLTDGTQPALEQTPQKIAAGRGRRRRGRGRHSRAGAVVAPTEMPPMPAWQPGDPQDLRVPRPQTGREPSPIWFFFRLRITDDILLLRGELKYYRAWCIVSSCDQREVVRSDAAQTSNMFDHLRTHHNLDRPLARLQAQGQCSCGSEHCRADTPHSAPGSRQEHLYAARIRAGKIRAHDLDLQAASQGSAADGGVLPALPVDDQRAVTDAWVRLVVVSHLRKYALAEDVGFKMWCAFLALKTGAKHCWSPPDHSAQRLVVAHDMKDMLSQGRADLAKVSRRNITWHHDVWSDQWRRAWVLGVAYWLELTSRQMEDGRKEFFLRFRRFLFAFEKVALMSDDRGGQHSFLPQATSLRMAWRRCGFGEEAAWATSDSGPTAVAVTRGLHKSEKRCLAHIPGIPIQRLLFGKKAPRQLLCPESSYDNHPAPEYLRAFEALRSFSHWCRDADHLLIAARHAKRLDVENWSPPRLDSIVKWGSCAEMAAECLVSQPVWSACAGENGCPLEASPAQWQKVEEALPVLDIVHAGVAVMQEDEALMGQYPPVMAGVRRQIAKLNSPFGTLYLRDLDRTERRNLINQKPGGEAGATWDSHMQLAQVASLVHPRWRRAEFLGPELADATYAKLGLFCIDAYMAEHGMQSKDEYVEAAPSLASTVSAKPPRRRLRAAAALHEELDAVAAGQPVAPGCVPAAAPEGDAPLMRRTLHEAVRDSLHTWRNAGPSKENPLEFWPMSGRAVHPFLWPGVLSLLQHRASNGSEERIFTKSGRLLGDKYSKNLDVFERLALNVNMSSKPLETYAQYQQALSDNSCIAEDCADFEPLLCSDLWE